MTRDLYIGGYINTYDPSLGISRQYQLVRYPAGDTSQPQFIGEVGGSSRYSYAQAYGLQRGPNGKLYMTGYLYDVVANQQYSVWSFDPQTEQIEPLIVSNVTQGNVQTYTNAYSLAIDRNGNLYVGGSISQNDTTTNQQVGRYSIAKYDPQGNLISFIAKSQDSSGVYHPADLEYLSLSQLAVDQYGNVYALDVDYRAKVIKVYEIEPSLPSVPRDLSTSESVDSLTINWQEPEDDGNAPITNYVIMARQVGGSWVNVATLDSSARSYRLTSLYGKSLLAGTGYEFTIIARTKAGDSPIAMISAQTSPLGAPSTGAGIASVLPIALSFGGITLGLIAVTFSLLPRRRVTTQRHQ